MWRRIVTLGVLCLAANLVFAAGPCSGLPGYSELKNKLQMVVNAGGNTGLPNQMWATVVNRDGIVCAVVFSGGSRGDQWPGSRVISAQKANTANAFSLTDLALSTANLYPLVQPGASLFGLSDSNPVDPSVAYGGLPTSYGQFFDPMVGKRIGGVNTFGGGLALYNGSGELLGGLGVSGNTSCADHIIAWKVRHAVGLDNAPTCDNISFPAHPHCGDDTNESAAVGALPASGAGCP